MPGKRNSSKPEVQHRKMEAYKLSAAGMSTERIAQVLGMNACTVRRYIKQARNQRVSDFRKETDNILGTVIARFEYDLDTLAMVEAKAIKNEDWRLLLKAQAQKMELNTRHYQMLENLGEIQKFLKPPEKRLRVIYDVVNPGEMSKEERAEFYKKEGMKDPRLEDDGLPPSIP